MKDKPFFAIDDTHLDVDRGERQYYFDSQWDDKIRIPTTYDGFEALLDRVAEKLGWDKVLFDDDVRNTMCGYIHARERTENTITLEELTRVLSRSVGMKLTWEISQDIEKRKREHREKLLEQHKLDKDKARIERAAAKRERKSSDKLKGVADPDETKAQ